MGDVDLVTAADMRLMQDLAQRVTAIRPDLVNSDGSFGELVWIWGKGNACDGGTWPRRLWFSGVWGSAPRCSCTRCISRGRPGPLT